MTRDLRLDLRLQRTWRRHWHSVIDEAIGQDPTFDFEAACNDPYGDFRMHFVTWDLPDESLRRCFEVLPCGAEMCNRATKMRSLYRANKSTMSEQEALELFQRGLVGLSQFVESEDLRKPIRVVRGTSAEIHGLTTRSDRVAILLEGVDWNGPFDTEVVQAPSFLTETLYRLAHSYEVADYIKWPLYPDPQSVDPHRGFALLALSDKYYPMLDDDGPVLFVFTDRGVE